MRKFVLYAALALAGVSALSSCNKSGNGELIGVQNRKAWYQSEPFGMIFVPSGVVQVGQSDQDVPFALNNPIKTVSIKAFYMDETEISNNEYRQFVQWVKDSLVHKKLGHVATSDGNGGKEVIDWSQQIDYSDAATADQLNDLYYPENQRMFNKREFNADSMVYLMQYQDYRAAAHDAMKPKAQRKDRSTFVIKKRVPIYPDTLCWVHDYAFAYNEPQTQNYFSHPAYDDYPVVGVSWMQARAFCVWRTKLLDDYREKNGDARQGYFRLPTEFEWEYAARGGRQENSYPWGGPYIRNKKGCFLANFKPGRGNYPDDGGLYTVKVTSYNPNDFGLYCMAGNVAEWTITAYNPSIASTVHDLNPDYQYNASDDEPIVRKRKVIRGGSWKDVGYMLQNSSRTYEYQDSAKSYIGFRCAIDFLGRSLDDF